ncbi:MAG: BON domain-containing protein [Candidatus Methanofastidiosia archaeon]
MKTQEKIKKDVVDQLAWDSRVDANDVTVTVDNNTVNLSGTVPSYSAMVTAENIAYSVIGVVDVNNRLTVKFPELFTAPTDKEIKDSVKRVLQWNTDVNTIDITFMVDNGVVTLEGSVPSFWQKITAESDAQRVQGVIDVINKIVVVPTEKIGDEIVGERVMDRIEKNTFADVDNIDVKVENGTVTISGNVSSYAQWKSVYDTAQYTAGVRDIEDILRIKYA